MDSKNDKEYLIAIKTEYKLLEKKYQKTKENLGKWEARVKLAGEKSKLNLKTNAEAEVEIIKNDINYITDQLMSLKLELEKVIRLIKESPKQQLTIDPNKLLFDMNNLIGNKNTLNFEEEMKILKVDTELEELKKKMEL